MTLVIRCVNSTIVCALALAPTTSPSQRGHLFPQPAPDPVALTSPQRTTPTFQYNAVHAKRATREISRARGLERKTAFGQNVQSVSVTAPLPLIENLVDASRFCLQSMLGARFPRTRSSTLRSSADRALPLLTPVAATVPETSKSHHACSAERADQVTYS